MSMEPTALQSQVAHIVADALDVPLEDVRPHSSFIDDLGAESIDFLDILFRVESAFDIKIPEDEMWKGSFEGTTPEALEAGVQRLRARMPDFNWGRLPARISQKDLPRLITVQTIVDYLSHRGIGGTAAGQPGTS